MSTTIDTIKVRMYRQGFGDCFLLQFMAGDERKSSMVIDCGLKNMDSEPLAKLSDVVKNIGEELTQPGEANPQLDFLVVTHEHWDHVSGFMPNRKLFDDFQIEQVWMAWTEDPGDPIAQQINKRLTKAKKALAIAHEKIKEETNNNPGLANLHHSRHNLLQLRKDFSKDLSELLGLWNLEAKAQPTPTPSGIVVPKFELSIGTESAMNHVKSLGQAGGGVKFFSPGKVIQDKKRLPGIRVYVLGPPKNAKLNKDAPSDGSTKETYFALRDASLDGFVGGLLSAYDSSQAKVLDDGAPFDRTSSVSIEQAKTHPTYQATYYSKATDWQTVNEDWLDIGGALALQLDDDTNNTSLVLAIEFIDSGKVLLFPGDAQVGSWESWHDVNFRIKNGDQEKKVTAAELLDRTVLYKVSHHCSHNATLKAKGLELMQSEDLVALIPEKQGSYPGIPHPPLVERLRRLTKGRMIFSADADFPANNFKNKKPPLLSSKEWQDFKTKVDIKDLYIELTIEN
jgi:beta-lactamase superfamily II metal-dependent hydrolase